MLVYCFSVDDTVDGEFPQLVWLLIMDLFRECLSCHLTFGMKQHELYQLGTYHPVSSILHVVVVKSLICCSRRQGGVPASTLRSYLIISIKVTIEGMAMCNPIAKYTATTIPTKMYSMDDGKKCRPNILSKAEHATASVYSSRNALAQQKPQRRNQ